MSSQPGGPREPRATGPAVDQVVSPAPAAEWRAVADADPFAMADQSPEWTAAAARWGWSDASRLYRLTDGSTVVLPLLRGGGRAPGLTWAASPPAGRGFGGLVGEAARDVDVVRAVLADLAAERWLSVRVRPAPETGDLWARAAPPNARVLQRRAHVLDLAPGPSALFEAMRKSTRRAIRRHQRDALDVRVGRGGDLLDEYADLHRVAVRQWAVAHREPQWFAQRRDERRDPIERLRACAAALGDRFRVWIAHHEGRPVAANVLVLGPTAHVIRAASQRSPDVPAGIMQHLDWLAVECASDEGCRALNLGESGTSASLGAYKEGLGAVAHDYVELRLERAPITAADHQVRRVVKRIVGFRD